MLVNEIYEYYITEPCEFVARICMDARAGYSPTALRTFSIVGAAAARAFFAPS